MKKTLFILYILFFAVLFTACSPSFTNHQTTSIPDSSENTQTNHETIVTKPVSEDTQTVTIPETTTAVTEPKPTTISTTPITEADHSELYIPDVSVEDVILYFNEVCLDAEFVYGGDPSSLQKWVNPIYYILHGDYTDEDMATLSSFTQWLNTIDGFPGISETKDPSLANLRIHFCTQTEMLELMGDNYFNMDGAVTFWYMDDEIYDAIICYRTDLDQHLRNSVILEEIYNGLGPVQDTSIRPDSIIYSEFSQPQSLTETDKLLLKLLYHPQLQCGMDAEACEAVIRQLYY